MPDQPGQRRSHASRFLAVAAMIAAAVVLAVVAPWHGHGKSPMGRAIAPVGQGPVLHAVITSRVPNESIVTLSSGAERPVRQQLEYWYDAGRDRLRVINIVNGGVVLDLLVPPNGSEPRLDPALTAFVSRYREALKSGRAREVGRGTFGGRGIVWLRFDYRRFGERVGIDAHTYRPVVIEPLGRNGRPAPPFWTISRIRTEPYRPRDFRAPRSAPQLSIRTGRLHTITPTRVTRRLGWAPFWLGHAFRNLPLQYVQVQDLLHEQPRRATTHGAYFAYGRGADRIQLSEARAREQIYWLGVGGDPLPGMVLLRRTVPQGSGVIRRDCRAMIHSGGVWITVEGWNEAASLCVDAARALVQLSK